MSWISKNYEKAALGGAVVVALGLAWMGWSKYSNVDENFPTALTGNGSSDTAVRDADLISQAVASMSRDRTWTQGVADDRPVDLFTGIPLFVSRTAPKSVDPRKGDPVHPPIPNIWWLENHVDPGFADSPNRDPDQDGFTNLEEYLSKTDPSDPKSFPPLIAKLKYLHDESLAWLLSPRFGSQGSFPFNFKDSKNRTNKAGAGDMVPEGGLFFTRDPMKNRFKLLGSEEREELNPAINLKQKVTIVRVEDQRPNKKGTIYEFPAPLPSDREAKFLHYDRSAVMSLEAVGQEGKEMTVEENTSFALPQENPKKEYLLKSVTPESIVVEYTSAGGEVKSYTIPKGGMPQVAP